MFRLLALLSTCAFLLHSTVQARGGPGELNRELMLRWAALDQGMSYEMTLDVKELAYADVVEENGRKRVAALRPLVDGSQTSKRLRVTVLGGDLHVRGAEDRGGTSVLVRHDKIFLLNDAGEGFSEVGRQATNESDYLPEFVFSPTFLHRHWLGDPWPEAMIPDGAKAQYEVRSLQAADADSRKFEVGLTALHSGGSTLRFYRVTRYERKLETGNWVPTTVEHLGSDRVLRRRASFRWTVVNVGGTPVEIPEQVEIELNARNPANNEFIPARLVRATLDTRGMQFRTAGADAALFGIIERMPSPAATAAAPAGRDTSRLYMMVFVVSVIAAAVLLGVRKYRKA